MSKRIGTWARGPAFDIDVNPWPWPANEFVDLTAVGALELQLAECNREQWKTEAELSREFREIVGL